MTSYVEVAQRAGRQLHARLDSNGSQDNLSVRGGESLAWSGLGPEQERRPMLTAQEKTCVNKNHILSVS